MEAIEINPRYTTAALIDHIITIIKLYLYTRLLQDERVRAYIGCPTRTLKKTRVTAWSMQYELFAFYAIIIIHVEIEENKLCQQGDNRCSIVLLKNLINTSVIQE